MRVDRAGPSLHTGRWNLGFSQVARENGIFPRTTLKNVMGLIPGHVMEETEL